MSAFAAEPEILLGSRLYPAGVIRQLKAFKMAHDIYGRLLDFLSHLAPLGLGYAPENLLVFSYDWRASNKLTAETLAREVRERSGDNSIGILAHSMGGIIARLMVADPENQDIVARIFRIVQVASPILGSAKAYYTLKERPCISAAFDWIWLWHHHLFPGRRAELTEAVRQFRSLYQMVPDASILHGPGWTRSPLDLEIWPEHLQPYVITAREIQAIFHRDVLVPLSVFFSNVQGTQSDYQVVQYGHILRVRRP
ncbi:MAG TPA: hypothetical protein VMW75_09090, partial [Thermoanaerobaculia bacterium]|nr:hypothetical protein [Thermoanaerobaculia bacterium]